MILTHFMSGIRVQEEFQPKLCLSHLLLSQKRCQWLWLFRTAAKIIRAWLDQLMERKRSRHRKWWGSTKCTWVCTVCFQCTNKQMRKEGRNSSTDVIQRVSATLLAPKEFSWCFFLFFLRGGGGGGLGQLSHVYPCQIWKHSDSDNRNPNLAQTLNWNKYIKRRIH